MDGMVRDSNGTWSTTGDAMSPSFILATSNNVPSEKGHKLVAIIPSEIDIIPSETSSRTLMMRLEPEMMRLAGKKAILEQQIEEERLLAAAARTTAAEREAALEVQLISLQHGLCEYHDSQKLLSIELSDAERRVQSAHAATDATVTSSMAERDVLRAELRRVESDAAALRHGISLTRDRSLITLSLRRTKRVAAETWDDWVGVWLEIPSARVV